MHGDLVRKNLRVLASRDGPHIVPFDWETGGWGAPLADFSRVSTSRHTEQPRAASWVVAIAGSTVWRRCEVVFRLLAAVSWEIPALSSRSVSRPIYRLGLYDEKLELAMERLGLPMTSAPGRFVVITPGGASGGYPDPAHAAFGRLFGPSIARYRATRSSREGVENRAWSDCWVLAMMTRASSRSSVKH